MTSQIPGTAPHRLKTSVSTCTTRDSRAAPTQLGVNHSDHAELQGKLHTHGPAAARRPSNNASREFQSHVEIRCKGTQELVDLEVL